MLSLRHLTISLFFVVSLAGLSAGQDPKTAASLCSTNGLAFPCPAWEINDKSSTSSPFTAFEPKSGTTLFAFSPSPSDKGSYSMSSVVGVVIADRFSRSHSTFEVKKSNDFWGSHKFSEYEVDRIAEVAFNAELKKALHYHVVSLDLGERKIIVGFVIEAASGDKSETWFKKWTGGGQMTATYGLQKLINSITGESKKDHDAPGGPPPMAAPPKKNS